MSLLNADIPHFYCYVRKEFLYNLESHHAEFEGVSVFACSSVPGTAIGFHCLTDCGAAYFRVPIHALVWRTPVATKAGSGTEPEASEFLPLDYLQLWDCFGYEFSVHTFDYLDGHRCKVRLKDNSIVLGSYMFSIDWMNNQFSDTPWQYKCLHMLKLENGQFALQPNNRILWHDPSFTLKSKIPDYKVNTHVWRCETERFWTAEGDQFFYETKEEKK